MINLRQLPILLFFLCPFFISAGMTEGADTLLNASTATRVLLQTNPSSITVNVFGVNGSPDNFFYQTGIPGSEKQKIQSTLEFVDISNVSVLEHDGRITVSFISGTDSPRDVTLDIPDPDNRYVRTWLGKPVKEFGINLSNTRTTQWNLVSGGFGFGFVTPVDCKPDFDASMGRSYELTWAMVLGVSMRHGHHSVRAGLGFDWRNYVTKGDRFFFKDDETISLLPYDEEMTGRRSRIKVFSLQLPVLYGISFGRRNHWGIELGPVINFNTGGSIKTQYKMDGTSVSLKTGHIGQRPVTVDIMATVHYKAIGLYARYAPMNVLKSSTGLDFRSFSTGIMIGF